MSPFLGSFAMVYNVRLLIWDLTTLNILDMDKLVYTYGDPFYKG